MKESAMLAKNFTLAMLVEGAMRGMYDMLPAVSVASWAVHLNIPR
jgi:hypothetical protein